MYTFILFYSLFFSEGVLIRELEIFHTFYSCNFVIVVDS